MDICYAFLTGQGNLLSAYDEFRLFIGYYLLSLKNRNPAVYNQLLSDTAFKTLYHSIEQRYGQLVQEYKACCQEIVQRSGGKIVVDKGQVFWLETNESMQAGDGDALLLQPYFTQPIQDILSSLH